MDEWSGDPGVGAQYFSQQAVGRLLPPAGIDLPSEMPLPVKLEQVQHMAAGDLRAARIYETIGVYFGYAIATLRRPLRVAQLLVLGRVLTGAGGDLPARTATPHPAPPSSPKLPNAFAIHIPDEKEKRHGQAIAAASLPALATRR